MTQRKSTALRFGLLPSLMTNSDICFIRSTQSTQLGKLGAQAWLRQTTLQTLDVPLHRGLQERQGNAMSIAYTQQMLSNDEQDGVACGEHQGSEDTKFLYSLTHPNTPPPEEADELLDTQRQASLLDSAQLLLRKR